MKLEALFLIVFLTGIMITVFSLEQERDENFACMIMVFAYPLVAALILRFFPPYMFLLFNLGWKFLGSLLVLLAVNIILFLASYQGVLSLVLLVSWAFAHVIIFDSRNLHLRTLPIPPNREEDGEDESQ